MGEVSPSVPAPNIQGVRILKLRQIIDERGAVIHMMRSDSPLFSRFGEVYFSEINPGVVKAWKRHKKMSQNLAVPSGRVRFVIYDDRERSPTKGEICELVLGRPDRYLLVHIPKLLWYGFQGISESPSLLANCTDLPHDPMEVENLGLDEAFIPYNWPQDFPG